MKKVSQSGHGKYIHHPEGSLSAGDVYDIIDELQFAYLTPEEMEPRVAELEAFVYELNIRGLDSLEECIEAQNIELLDFSNEENIWNNFIAIKHAIVLSAINWGNIRSEYYPKPL